MVPCGEVDVDGVAGPPQPVDQRLDVTAAVETVPPASTVSSSDDDEELGRVHRHPARLAGTPSGHDEVRPGRQRAQVLEGARRPREVEAAQVGRDGVHVDVAVADPAPNSSSGHSP